MLAGLLIVGAIVLVATNNKEVREINIFALVLVVQSLPFLAAVGARRDRAHAAQRLRLLAQRSRRVSRELLAGRRAANGDAGRKPRAAASLTPEPRRTGPVGPLLARGSAVSTSFTQYDVPNGITSSLKL